MPDITISSTPIEVIETELVPVENVLIINAPNANVGYKNSISGKGSGRIFKIEVLIGSFQFAAGVAISASNPSYAATKTLELSLSETNQLRFKAATQNDKFIITT